MRERPATGSEAYAGGELGRFQLEAAIQAVHAARATTGTTDWPALRDLHRHLSRLFPSLGARVALAAVTAETDGPEAALALLDELDEDGPGSSRPGRRAPTCCDASAATPSRAPRTTRRSR